MLVYSIILHVVGHLNYKTTLAVENSKTLLEAIDNATIRHFTV